MPLADLQRRFVASLYGEAADLRDDIRGGGGIPAADRIAIYRHNLQAGFEKALALEFPVIAALCGEAFFAGLAREFQQAHPSVSGDLHHVGAPFPAYLRERFRGSDHAYFADVAALEWAREESARAADAPPLDLQALGGLAGEDAPRVRIAMHPAMRLIESNWPIFSIWDAHQGHGEVPGVDLGAGPEQVLVRRVPTGPILERIGAADLALLATLQRCGTLGEAFDAAVACEPAYDIGAALRRFVAGGVFTAG
ncbi:MAG: putative DNA-binding domain-containing protein [Steroidobacteraceae bacterium]